MKGFHQSVLDPLAAAVNLKELPLVQWSDVFQFVAVSQEGDEPLSEDGRDRLRMRIEY